MKRVWLSFFLAPLLISLFWGQFGAFALLAYFFMLVITLTFAVPLFFILKKLHLLQWWHALLAGASCGLGYELINGINIDRLISANNLFYMGLGALVGSVFWWIGLFKNPSFPFISSKFPLSFLLVIPLAVLGFKAHQAISLSDLSFPDGRVISILVEPSEDPKHGQALVQLKNGLKVQADLSNTWPITMVLGKCVHVENRFSTIRMHFIYEISVPFIYGNEC